MTDQVPLTSPRPAGGSTPWARTFRVGSCIRLAFLAPLLIAVDEPPVVPPSDRAPEIRLTGNTVTLPIVMVDAFPFIPGAIAGMKGKIMFDTGALEALVINDHRVPVVGGRSIGAGHFGSGQSYSINLVPTVRNIELGPIRYPSATSVSTQDARQLEGITPDFIGWLGYRAFADYAFKLDYRRSKVTFYKGDPKRYLRGEKVIATLDVEPRKRPNDPIITIKIGDITAEAVFDTGQYGMLYVDEPTKTRLIQAGWLKPSAEDKDAFDLTGLTMAGSPVAPISKMEVDTQPYRPGKSVGMTGPANMTIGYGFLQHYKTVWDYPRHRLYLLAP